MSSKIDEFKVFFDAIVSRDGELKQYQDPEMDTKEVLKKMKGL